MKGIFDFGFVLVCEKLDRTWNKYIILMNNFKEFLSTISLRTFSSNDTEPNIKLVFVFLIPVHIKLK